MTACTNAPKRERFPGPQGRTTDQAAAETSKAVMGGFDPLNNRLPGMGGGAAGATSMDQNAPAAESIRGVLKVGGSVVLREDMFLFISAKRAEGGPPIAVHRDQGVEFPYKFVLSKSNVMMAGTDFSGPLEITARLKQDSDPLSKMKGDYYGVAHAKVGDQNVEIVIDRPAEL